MGLIAGSMSPRPTTGTRKVSRPSFLAEAAGQHERPPAPRISPTGQRAPSRLHRGHQDREHDPLGKKNSRGTRPERQTESRPEPLDPRIRPVRTPYQDRIQSGLVQKPIRCCTGSPHQPALLGVWARRCRQLGQPGSVQVPELRTRNKRRREHGRKYQAPRCRNLGQGVPPETPVVNKRNTTHHKAASRCTRELALRKE